MGKGLAGDFLDIASDFYNGAYGDAPLPATDISQTVAVLFLYLPYSLSDITALFNINARGEASACTVVRIPCG